MKMLLRPVDLFYSHKLYRMRTRSFFVNTFLTSPAIVWLRMVDQRSFDLSRSSLSIAPPKKVTFWIKLVASSRCSVLRHDLMT